MVKLNDIRVAKLVHELRFLYNFSLVNRLATKFYFFKRELIGKVQLLFNSQICALHQVDLAVPSTAQDLQELEVLG